MLGRFLEYSVAARPLAASFGLLEALGFESIAVGDTLPHPYLVYFDGTVAIGLHEREQRGPQLTFVRPGLREHVRPLRRLGLHFTHEHLGDGEFNSVGFVDPGGLEVVLLEARTFPPGEWRPGNIAICGEFFELSVPAADLAASSRFWQSLGLAPLASGAAPHRWQRLTGHGVTLGLHEVQCRPGLSFRCEGLDARLAYLEAKGIAARTGTPLADRAQPSATVTGLEGTALYLFEKGGQ
jgi:hypothetical protein